MSFHNIRLPIEIERGATGGPGFNTTILVLSSGFEKRNSNWGQSRGRWSIGYGLDKKENLFQIVEFFQARRGRAIGFRFRDWTDYQVGTAVPQQIAVGDGVATRFQIFKRYSDFGGDFNRPLTRLVDGTVSVFLGGVLQSVSPVVGFDIELDINTGVVEFVTAPAVGQQVTVTAEFDVPVRFDSDQLELTAVTSDTFTVNDIDIVELRETLEIL